MDPKRPWDIIRDAIGRDDKVVSDAGTARDDQAQGAQLPSDPALANFTHFTLVLEEPDHPAGEVDQDDVGISHYSHVNHRYYKGYIHDANWRLRLDPRLGIILANRPATPVQVQGAIDRVALELRAATAGSRQQAAPPGSGGTAGGGGGDKLKLPEDLVRWVWVVTNLKKDVVDYAVIDRTQQPWGMAVLDLSGPGDYTVSCTVAFKDRIFERKISLKLQEYLIAGIGDSYASGEGNPDQNGRVEIWDKRCAFTTASMAASTTPNMSVDPKWVEPEANRSLRAGQALAAKALSHRISQTAVYQKPDLTSVTLTRVVFLHYARSGAKITTGLLTSQREDGDYIGCGQIEELKRAIQQDNKTRKIDALMISIGGNDLKFSNVVEGLVTGDIHDFFSVSGVLKYLYDNVRVGPYVAGMSAISAIAGSPSGLDEQARKQIEENLKKRLGVDLPAGQKGDLETLYETVYDRIDKLNQAVGIGEVYITGYPPSPFGVNTANGLEYQYCGVFDNWDASLTPADSKMLERMGLLLNKLIKAKAAEFGWHYVDVAPGFSGHGYCARGKETYFVAAEDSCNRQGNFNGTLHPNGRGHEVIAKALVESMRKHTLSRAPL